MEHKAGKKHTFFFYVPQFEAVFIIYGHKVLPKWNQRVHVSLVSLVTVNLLAPTECLDGILIRSKDSFSRNCQTLDGVWLLRTCTHCRTCGHSTRKYIQMTGRLSTITGGLYQWTGLDSSGLDLTDEIYYQSSRPMIVNSQWKGRFQYLEIIYTPKAQLAAGKAGFDREGRTLLN